MKLVRVFCFWNLLFLVGYHHILIAINKKGSLESTTQYRHTFQPHFSCPCCLFVCEFSIVQEADDPVSSHISVTFFMSTLLIWRRFLHCPRSRGFVEPDAPVSSHILATLFSSMLLILEASSSLSKKPRSSCLVWSFYQPVLLSPLLKTSQLDVCLWLAGHHCHQLVLLFVHLLACFVCLKMNFL